MLRRGLRNGATEHKDSHQRQIPLLFLTFTRSFLLRPSSHPHHTNMSTVTYFITGASRGLGLEFATQLLAHSPNTRIVATARDPTNAPLLQALVKANEGRIHVLKVDVTDEKSVKVCNSL